MDPFHSSWSTPGRPRCKLSSPTRRSSGISKREEAQTLHQQKLHFITAPSEDHPMATSITGNSFSMAAHTTRTKLQLTVSPIATRSPLMLVKRDIRQSSRRVESPSRDFVELLKHWPPLPHRSIHWQHPPPRRNQIAGGMAIVPPISHSACH